LYISLALISLIVTNGNKKDQEKIWPNIAEVGVQKHLCLEWTGVLITKYTG
jgi:hypothetical protein